MQIINNKPSSFDELHAAIRAGNVIERCSIDQYGSPVDWTPVNAVSGIWPPDRYRILARETSKPYVWPPFPEAGANPQRCTRAEIIEGLRDGYDTMVRLERQKDPTVRGYPDMEKILDYIDEHGLPPKKIC
jgi:hypothetical protein